MWIRFLHWTLPSITKTAGIRRSKSLFEGIYAYILFEYISWQNINYLLKHERILLFSFICSLDSQHLLYLFSFGNLTPAKLPDYIKIKDEEDVSCATYSRKISKNYHYYLSVQICLCGLQGKEIRGCAEPSTSNLNKFESRVDLSHTKGSWQKEAVSTRKLALS